MHEINPREAAELRVGMLLREKWRLERILGVGGMACVYAARHRNGNRVAVKMLHATFASDVQIRSRFLREGYAANKVEHPGAVRVLDDDIAEDGSPFLVMELLEGQSLDAVLRRHPLPLGDALRITRGILEVLISAHDRGIVHRDIKPENVFVTDAGEVKILDFGIARLREASGSSAGGTLGGMVLGTPAFMPPEQARGRWDEVDGQSDVWAVGATLLTLLAGRSLRAAETMNEELLLAMNQPLPLAGAALPGIVPDVATVIDRALAFDKSWRWRNARAMHEAVCLAERSTAGQEAVVLAPQGTVAPMQVVITPRALGPSDALVHHGPTVSAPPPSSVANRSAPAPQVAKAARAPEPKGRSMVLVGLVAVVGIVAVAGAVLGVRTWTRGQVAGDVAASGNDAESAVPVAPVVSAAPSASAPADAGAAAASSAPSATATPRPNVKRGDRGERGGGAPAPGVAGPPVKNDNPLDRGRY